MNRLLKCKYIHKRLEQNLQYITHFLYFCIWKNVPFIGEAERDNEPQRFETYGGNFGSLRGQTNYILQNLVSIILHQSPVDYERRLLMKIGFCISF